MAASIQKAGRKRLVHHLDTPYTATLWPEISPDNQDAILELLCNLLSPIGQYKRAHLKPSRGRRAARRALGGRDASEPGLAMASISAQARPDISNYVHVGFNAITRELQSIAKSEAMVSPVEEERKSYCMVFVARGNHSPAFNCHFPRMIGVASRRLGSDERIRLIGLSKPCSERLSICLGIARVSSLAIKKDAPGAEPLWTFVQEHVAGLDSRWLDDAVKIQYEMTRILSVETTAGSKKTKSSSRLGRADDKPMTWDDSLRAEGSSLSDVRKY